MDTDCINAKIESGRVETEARKEILPVQKIQSILDDAQEWAASVGYAEADVDSIIKQARQKRKQ